MIGEGVYARAYARALFGSAVQRGELESVTQDVLALEKQWQGSQELRSFSQLHLPGDPEHHAGRVEQLWGTSFTRIVIHLLKFLAEWDQLRLIPLITRHFQALTDRAQNCSNVHAWFACEPKQEEIAHVRQLVADAHGPVMKLTVAVDAELIAGVRIFINDKRVDASLAGRMTRMRYGLSKPMHLEEAAS